MSTAAGRLATRIRLCLFHPQDEEKLLLAVDEAQEKLEEQKRQLLEKEKQVEAAKAEVEQLTKSVRGLSRYQTGTFSVVPSCKSPPPPHNVQPSLSAPPPLPPESWPGSSGRR